MLARLLLEPQGGEGGNGAATAAETRADEKAGDRGANLKSAADGLVARHGDPTAALLVLLGENHTHREKIRELSGRLPREGSVVLEGDDAKHWSSYRELGKPSDLKAALGERDTFRAEAGTLRKAEVVRSAAGLHGFEADVLATLAEKLDLEVVEEKKDGKAVKVAVVKGDGDERTHLDKYAEQHWAKFLPSLRVAEERPRPIGSPAVQARPRTVPAGNGQAAGKRRPTSSF